MGTIILFAILIIALSIQMALVTKVLCDVRKYTQFNGCDIGDAKWTMSMIEKMLKKHVYNSRKRHTTLRKVLGFDLDRLYKTTRLLNQKIEANNERIVNHSNGLFDAMDKLYTLETKGVEEIKKGNKDQQEIKTKLTNLRQMTERTKKMNEVVKKAVLSAPLLWLGDKKSIPEGYEIVAELPAKKAKKK